MPLLHISPRSRKSEDTAKLAKRLASDIVRRTAGQFGVLEGDLSARIQQMKL